MTTDTDDMILVQVRLPVDLVKVIDHIGVEVRCSRPKLYAHILRRAMEELDWGKEIAGQTDIES